MNLSRISDSLLFGVLILGSAVVQLVMACAPKPKGSPLLVEKVASSEIVAHGVVTRHVSDKALRGSYTAVLDVHCVYKGGPLPPVINIINAGYVSEKCVSAELPVGTKKLVYLRREREGNYSPTFTEDPATDKYLEELSLACGITNRYIYPQGVSASSAKADCRPENYVTSSDNDDDCPGEATTPRLPKEEITPRGGAAHISLAAASTLISFLSFLALTL